MTCFGCQMYMLQIELLAKKLGIDLTIMIGSDLFRKNSANKPTKAGFIKIYGHLYQPGGFFEEYDDTFNEIYNTCR